MTPLKEALQREVLPSLTGHAPPSPTMRALFSLPARLGGLGIRNPSGMSAIHHRTSVQVTEPIVELILNQHHGDNGSQDRLQEALSDRSAPGNHQREKAQGRRGEASTPSHPEPAVSTSALCRRPGHGRRRIILALGPAPSGSWVRPAQGCVPRRHRPAARLGADQPALTLCMR